MAVTLEQKSHEARPPSGAPAFGERRFGAVNWLGLQTLIAKEIRRFMKVSFQTIFAPVISTLLFLIVFMQAFGRADTVVHGVPYVEFLAPGLIMMAILSNAFANSSSSLIIGKVQGSIVDVLMPPLSPSELTVAFVVGAAARGLLVGFVTALTSAGFMALSGASMKLAEPWAIAYFGLAAALMFGMLGVVGGIWAEKFDQLAAVTNFVITPLTFLSGTFYAIGSLPEPFLTASHFNPVFYLIDGLRFGFTGVYEAAPTVGVGATMSVNAVLAVWCYRLFRVGYKLKS
ncbi:ABC transporter permease [Amphiplicatus metriothermophilus]|uniref:Transport permease protein n=1 Tax=Amphiplicatus metriothermophilus TaxID=1519374 RepID=A0A239PJE3_9PROT|nr:ABC transporter permease [Amphiplicatus metriothermophilus]MBB5517768.1 ABC-2 type transport system permease protein [Amphiplicatus metriothermophilus]SNT67898.1 ABC-2 type transport system permease protein [Amphiplicatus metriothermophilus]